MVEYLTEVGIAHGAFNIILIFGIIWILLKMGSSILKSLRKRKIYSFYSTRLIVYKYSVGDPEYSIQVFVDGKWQFINVFGVLTPTEYRTYSKESAKSFFEIYVSNNKQLIEKKYEYK